MSNFTDFFPAAGGGGGIGQTITVGDYSYPNAQSLATFTSNKLTIFAGTYGSGASESNLNIQMSSLTQPAGTMYVKRMATADTYETVADITNSPNNFTIAQNITPNVISTNTTAATGRVYVLTASLALTLPAGVLGESLQISNRSAVETCTVVPAGSDKIMGSATTMTLDTAAASFELIFTGTAQGWVIIGQ